VKTLQKLRLLRRANSPAGIIFQLKVNHKMIEASQLDVTSQGEKLAGLVIYRPERKE
ncbi:unnamed protein product, partial [marine sediment metagenome]